MKRILKSSLLIIFLMLFSSVYGQEKKLELEFVCEFSNIPVSGQITHIEYGPDLSLYYLDSKGGNLHLLNAEGKYQGKTGGFGFDENSFNDASDLFIAGFEVWVCDRNNDRIVRFDRRLASLGALNGMSRDGDYLFERPVSAIQLSGGDIIVLEGDRLDCVRLDSQGDYIDNFADFSSSTVELHNPKKLVEYQKNILIYDSDISSILRFDQFGTQSGRIFPGESYFPIKNLSSGEKYLWICGKFGVATINQKGEVFQTWPDLISDETEINDICVRNGLLAIASGQTIRIFKIISNN